MKVNMSFIVDAVRDMGPSKSIVIYSYLLTMSYDKNHMTHNPRARVAHPYCSLINYSSNRSRCMNDY